MEEIKTSHVQLSNFITKKTKVFFSKSSHMKNQNTKQILVTFTQFYTVMANVVHTLDV